MAGTHVSQSPDALPKHTFADGRYVKVSVNSETPRISIENWPEKPTPTDIVPKHRESQYDADADHMEQPTAKNNSVDGL